jgi:signal transduction histidine kinase/CheY-like chemotaxis protein
MTPQATIFSGFIPTRAELGRWSITFLAFLLTAKLGQFLYTGLDTAPAFIWPPYGIALAAVYLWGNRMSSAVMIGAFVAIASNGSPWPSIIASTLGNPAQALVGAYLFRLFGFRPDFSRLRDTLLLFGVSLVITTIVPTFSLISRGLFGPAIENPGEMWRIVWAGGILSVLVMTPLITGFIKQRSINRERLTENSIALLLVASITYLLFWTKVGVFGGIPLVYFLLVPFFWIALRFSPRSTAFALFITSVIAVSGAVTHVPEGTHAGQWLFQTELLLEIFAVIFLIICSAIEDRRTATEELRAHVDQLENAVTQISEQDSAKSDFLAILAHELRNPLAPVLSTLELLRMRRTPDDEETKLVAGAEQRLHMMGRLLDDLLDMSRVSEKRLKLQKEYVSLRALAQRSVESSEPMMDKFSHTLTVSLPTTDATLFADPLRIEQVLVNVLNNAAKYTPPGGAVEFKAETHGSRAIITIRDNGTGIEQKMLSRIFEPFIQVSNTKYGTSGVGVGLALAKELVELHDGSIVALSAGLGRGSTFVIEFPTVASPAPVEKPVVHIPERSTGALNVLIVDDNQAGCEALGRLLSFRGHKTTLAFTGNDGIVKALEQSPDVILLDIGLPDMEGYDVARRLRFGGSQSFILALTGFGQDDDRRKALDAGCDGHLTKPVGLSDIEAALRSRFAA